MQSILDKMYVGRTRVFGHRGAMGYAPMNTLPAFELASQQGADGVELDVRLTSDGQLVILHDATVDRTSNGRGEVAAMTLAQVRELDAGAWFDPKFAGTRIPTLSEVFEAIGQRLYINVEIKSDGDTAARGIEQKVADEIARFGLKDRIIVSSFDPGTLHRFRAAMPDVPIGYLYEAGTPAEFTSLMDDLPHEACHPYFQQIDADYMAWAKAQGYRVNTWTVNDPVKAVELRNLGVDAIITNYPDKIIAALG
jgi:glycerophosphoryl diester phosphodiesterase